METKLQNKIIKYLESQGAYVRKIVIANRNGTPDLFVCYKGKFIAIEVKIAPNKVSSLQLVNLEKIKQAGGYSIIAYKLEDVVKLINSL